jgi:mannose-6-phosphate isomerase class I
MTAALPIRQVEKPWGRETLPAPFAAPAGERIGEIWFEPPTALSELLVKYIFTSEALSVQVHPSDMQTIAKGIGRQGKEECWLIIERHLTRYICSTRFLLLPVLPSRANLVLFTLGLSPWYAG